MHLCNYPLVFYPVFDFYAVPPVISSRGGTVTVVVNEPARLECEASGVPLPILTWLKDGSPVASVSHGLQVLINDTIEFMFRVINHILLHHDTFPKEHCGCIIIIHYTLSQTCIKLWL